MKRTKICAERPKGQEDKLGVLNGSVMSKSSILPKTLVELLTETGGISNLHKISMNINEAHLALYIDKHTAGIQIHKNCRSEIPL